jgi:hypothetical protein
MNFLLINIAVNRNSSLPPGGFGMILAERERDAQVYLH